MIMIMVDGVDSRGRNIEKSNRFGTFVVSTREAR